MIWLLGIQAAIFAAWATLSLMILAGLLGRAIRRTPPAAGSAGANAVQSYLLDPETRLRRRLWLGLTVALFLCSLATVALVMFA
ncbi:MAG: hypothetical protein AAFY65_15875 [Pseudomonadota bacterium]